LTGISNIQGFFVRTAPLVELMVREKQALAVYIIDVDHFKKINETYGSRVGESIVRFLAQQMKNLCRRYDIFARYSIDGFVVFTAKVNKKTFENIAERFRKNLVEKMEAKKLIKEKITLSLGCAYGILKEKDHLVELQKIIEIAGEMLYKAKKNGGDRCSFIFLE
jgi:diguanylate cyclase (GGDEF)-like protein